MPDQHLLFGIEEHFFTWILCLHRINKKHIISMFLTPFEKLTNLLFVHVAKCPDSHYQVIYLFVFLNPFIEVIAMSFYVRILRIKQLCILNAILIYINECNLFWLKFFLNIWNIASISTHNFTNLTVFKETT